MSAFVIERATARDVPAIVALLRADPLGRDREDAADTAYEAAFAEIDADPRQLLVVARDPDGRVSGTMQLTLVPGLSRGGATRLQIEAVRVAAGRRGSGLGTELFAFAHRWGREQGAVLAQLTTDRSRTDAHRFYRRLGYVASHDGFKLPLD